MEYQTFRGVDVQEPLLHVREPHGTDALIESTLRGNICSGALNETEVACALCTGGTRPVRAGHRERGQWLLSRVGEKLECKTGRIETPGRRFVAWRGPIGVGKTTTLAKLPERAVLCFNGACAW